MEFIFLVLIFISSPVRVQTQHKSFRLGYKCKFSQFQASNNNVIELSEAYWSPVEQGGDEMTQYDIEPEDGK